MKALQDLEDLTASPGWSWLQDAYVKEWGAEAFLLKLQRIANATDPSEMKTAKTEQAWASRMAVDGLLRMPQEAIRRMREELRQANSTGTESRRGPGL